MSKKNKLKSDNEFLFLVQNKELNYHDKYFNKIYIWNDYIVYHYSEYYYCLEHDIDIEIIPLPYSNKQEVLIWLCEQELLREDLFHSRKKFLIGFLFYLLSSANFEKSNTLLTQTYIATELQKKYDISTSTALNYKKYYELVNEIMKRDIEISRDILYETLKLTYNTLIYISELSRDDFRYIKNYLKQEHDYKLCIKDIKNELCKKDIQIQKNKMIQQQNFQIRQVPIQDPDSEIVGLSLTIPSWIGSITRAHLRTNFNLITDNARKQTEEQLEILLLTINNILADIKQELKEDIA